MTFAFIAVVFGLSLLVWSADRFVEGSASTARHFGMPPLLIGMVIGLWYLRAGDGGVGPGRLAG